MFREDGYRPNDQRGFIHKKILGIGAGLAKRFIPPLGLAGDIISTGRSLFGGKPASRSLLPRSATARRTLAGAQGVELGRAMKFDAGTVSFPASVSPVGGGGTFGAAAAHGVKCDKNPGESDICCQLRNSGIPGQRAWQQFCGKAGERQGAPVGDAVMGQYGAALEPGVMQIERSVCLPGMQLAKDGLCYNKGAITNSQRMWPRGRRPLLTGGDMRAISIAARAGGKLDRTTKRLRKMGMMKALPARRALPAHRHAKPVGAVSVS